MGMQFEYDEKEGTFYYFLISFYALCLFPLTYYFWPKPEHKETAEQLKRKCHCEPCQMKRVMLKSVSPWKATKRRFIKLIFLLLWIGFIYSAFKVSQIELEWTEFDPFAELGIDRDATVPQIKKAYRQLSLKLHPDKGGDPKRFIRITKAFAALTNEASRLNWQEYGNPDGPGVTQFGIALPKWIVDKKNSIWVLGAYVLVFMIILPISVGTWWYRRIKFDDHILRNTTILYYRFLSHSPTITVKRIIMILAASFEFERSHNSEIIERPSDNEELTCLIRQLPHMNVNIREKPFCAAYATKARALLHAHLSRLQLPPNTLQLDKQIVLKKCPWLINEMNNAVAQIISTLTYNKSPRSSLPLIDTVVNIMRVSQMLVQALWENQSPLLQLPHIREDMLRHFVTKRRNIRTLVQLAEMNEEDRRALLRNLTDDQYRDLINVLASLPHVTMDCSCEVLDEEDTTITANSLVTVTVLLKRRSLGEEFPSLIQSLSSSGSSNTISSNGGVGLKHHHHHHRLSHRGVNGEISGGPYGGDAAAMSVYSNRTSTYTKGHTDSSNQMQYSAATPLSSEEAAVDAGTASGDEAGANNEYAGASSSQNKPTVKSNPVWEKNRNKKKGAKGKPKKSSKGGTKSKPQAKTTNSSSTNKGEPSNDNNDEETPDVGDSPRRRKIGDNGDGANAKKTPAKSENRDGQSQSSESESEDNDAASSRQGVDDENWTKFQRQARKENSLETKPRTTHIVHCPYFPTEKLEAWWIYVANKKCRALVTQPIQICSLQVDEEVTLRFRPPANPGQYTYTVYLRSDCYMDLDVKEDFKIDVGEAVVVTDHPQWKLSDNEDDDDTEVGKGEVSDAGESDGSSTEYDYDD